MAPEDDTYDIEMEHVTKRFGDVTAVRDLNLQIRKGEFFSLLGPSGCGKTTTLRMLAGFEQPTEGEIFVANTPVAGMAPYRRPVNTVFQNYALFPHLNVFDNVAFGLRRKKVAKPELQKRVHEALEMVEMEKMIDRKPRQLSGGQQQRVALARALVNLPTVLLLDEPLGALDAKLRKAMQLELKKLQGDVGITFIYVTHDQEEALTMSDRIAVMSQGAVEHVGTPSEIYQNPQSAFVANFIGVSNIYLATVRGIVGDTATCVTSEGLAVTVSIGDRSVRTGQEIGIVVRPERVLVTPVDRRSEIRGCENVFRGRIKAVVYIGAATQLVVDIEGKHLAQALQQNRDDADVRQWSVDQEVSVSFGARSCTLIIDVVKGMAQQDLMGEVVKRM